MIVLIKRLNKSWCVSVLYAKYSNYEIARHLPTEVNEIIPSESYKPWAPLNIFYARKIQNFKAIIRSLLSCIASSDYLCKSDFLNIKIGVSICTLQTVKSLNKTKIGCDSVSLTNA